MKITILDSTKKKKFIEELSSLGIKKIPLLLLKSGEERIRAYSGNLGYEELLEICRILPIEGVGLYFGKEMIDRHGVKEVRLSIDGLHVLKDQINSNVLVLTKEQEREWFYGRNIDLDGSKPDGFYAIKDSKDGDFIGTGKVGNGGKVLYNFLPKERRRKTSTLS